MYVLVTAAAVSVICIGLGAKRVSYFIKMLLFYLSLLLVSSLVLPWIMLKRGDVQAMMLPSRIMCVVSVLLGLRWHVSGLQDNWLSVCQQHSAVVVVANHQCSLDLLGLFTLWPLVRKMTIVAKQSLKYMGPFGLVAYFGGIVFIERKRGKQAHEIIQNALEQCKQSGTSLFIFPEGTRTHNRHQKSMRPFKKGAFTAAIAAQVPIVPVVFSHFHFLDTERHILHPSDIHITVLPAVSTHGMSVQNADALAHDIRQQMLAVFSHPQPDSQPPQQPASSCAPPL